MAKVVEPPVLISRTQMFVLAASIVVLAVLSFTLYKMAPLTKPEVFFLRNPSGNVNYVLEQPSPKEREFKNEYIDGFIRTYIIARNTIDDNTGERWSDIVKLWSSVNVYERFRNTATYEYVKNNGPLFGVVCTVSFADKSVVPSSKNGYLVWFERTCENSGGQISKKSYTINIVIRSYLDNKSSIILDELEKLENNPLGIQITEYEVERTRDNTKGIDPLSDLDFYNEGF